MKAFLAGLLSLFAITAFSADIIVYWDTPLRAATYSGYRIAWGPTNQTTFAFTNIVNGGFTTNTTILGLLEGETYKLRAVTLGTNGLNSGWSVPLIFTVPETPINIRLMSTTEVSINPNGPWLNIDQHFVAAATNTNLFYQTRLQWVASLR